MIARDKIFKIIAEYSSKNIDGITEKTSLVNDLGLDSLDIIELTMTFEDELNIKIPVENDYTLGEDIKNFNTVGEIISYLEKGVI